MAGSAPPSRTTIALHCAFRWLPVLTLNLCSPRLVVDRNPEMCCLLARRIGLLQIVAERPFPFHFRVIRLWALILIKIVTLRQRFGVSEVHGFLARELCIRSGRRRGLRFGGRRSFDKRMYPQCRRRRQKITKLRLRFGNAIRAPVRWLSIFFANGRSCSDLCPLIPAL